MIHELGKMNSQAVTTPINGSYVHTPYKQKNAKGKLIYSPNDSYIDRTPK